MPNYTLTNRAVEDLSEIWLYTSETWSERQADKYYLLLIDSMKEVANRPEIGREYSEIINGLRGVKVGRHIIFYLSSSKNEIQVIRILHDRMDLMNKF